VLQPFKLTVTAVKSRPSDAANAEIVFSSPSFPPASTQQCPVPLQQPECLHYGGQHGFCTQYVEQAVDAVTNQPISDDPLVSPTISQYCSASPNPFTFFLTFNSAEFINDPGGAHGTGQNDYTDCQSQDFYPTQAGADPLRISGSNSKHVAFNAGEVFNGAITLNSPISSCNSLANCNPQFNVGQNISVKFTLLSKSHRSQRLPGRQSNCRLQEFNTTKELSRLIVPKP
jgi:hypothetical protein